MWANLNIRSVSKCAAEGPVPSASTSNRMNTYSYDAAGNLLTATGGTYGYDAENRLASAPGVTFDYDADGRRVQKATSSTAGTLYWYGKDGEPLVETDLSGNLKNEYVFFNGERVARRDSSANVFYYFEDELGSSRIITDASGNPCYDADLYPFGAEQYVYTNNCPQNYKFTGKERDPETGLDEFGARYFSSALGRFTTPDWAAKPTAVPYAKFGDPQTLNLYSYVENSPVNRADADGHADFLSALKRAAEDTKNAVQKAAKATINAYSYTMTTVAKSLTENSSFSFSQITSHDIGVSIKNTVLLATGVEEAKAASPGATLERLPQDENVNPVAPLANNGRGTVGPSTAQNALAQSDVSAAQARCCTDIRMNQQQVNAAGQRVGVNRPDLQYTEPNGQRQYVEYERPGAPRGATHTQRTLSNDPKGNVTVKEVPEE